MVWNIENSRVVWRRIMKILSREGVEPRVSGLSFKAVIQSVLLFCRDMDGYPSHGTGTGGFP